MVVGRTFLQKNRHPYIGTIGRLILPFYLTVKFTCIISCIFGHLTEPLPFGDVVEDSLPIDKLDIKSISSMKGMTSQEEEGLWPPTGDFWHFRYQFFHVFCNFFKLV